MKRALLCLLAACGGDDGPPPDAPPPFQMGSKVMVQITARGEAVPNIQVMFQNSDGSVVSVGLTDAAGKLGADIDNGGFVTVVEPRPDSGRDVVTTFAGAQEGDVLHLDFNPPGSTDTKNVIVRIVNDPVADPDGDPQVEPNAIFRVRSNCGETGVSPGIDNEITLLGCGDTAADFVVTSHTDAAVLVGSKFFKDVPLDAVVDLTGNNYTPVVTRSIEVTPKPAGAGDVSIAGVNRTLATDRGIVFETGTTVVFDSMTQTFASTVAMPDVPGATTMTTSATAISGVSLGTVYEWDAISNAGNYTFDLGALLPAYVKEDPAKPVATYAIDTGAMSWVEEPGNSNEPDLVRARISVFRDAIPVGRGWDWRIIAPRTGTQLAFPRLPADLTGFNFTPTAGDTVGVSELTTVKFSAGFDLGAVREHGFTSFNSMRAGASGSIVTQDLYEQPE